MEAHIVRAITEYVEMQLQRSGRTKLAVDYTTHFSLDDDRCACPRFWDMVLETTERWQEVTFSYDIEHRNSDIAKTLRGLSLPSLRTMVMTTEIDSCTEESLSEVCETWFMPKLENFRGALHKTGLKIQFRARLKSFHLSVGQWNLYQVAHPILGILDSSQVNKANELHLKFCGLTCTVRDTRSGSPVTMPDVRKLTLEFLNTNSGNASQGIARHLTLPELTHLVGVFCIRPPRNRQESALRDLCDKFRGFSVLAAKFQGNTTAGIKEITFDIRDGLGANEDLRWYRRGLEQTLVQGIGTDFHENGGDSARRKTALRPPSVVVTMK